ncbi:MAG: putative glycoside hydrolase [Spirochaetia bacterium]|nr:putative glycoside hydrolase [Spirochaetia bacterium]
MNARFRYIAITIIIFFALFLILNHNYYRIKTFFAPPVAANSEPKIPIAKKTFAALPAGFSHCGPFLVFSAEEDTSADDVAKAIIAYTSAYRVSALKRAILLCNALKDSKILKGRIVLIPESLPAFVHSPMNQTLPPLISARGLYMTGTSAGNPALLEKLPYLKKNGINAIVFDVKDVDGILNYKSRIPAAVKYNLHEKACIDNVDMFIKKLKEQDIYVIARIAAFRDGLLVRHAPELAVKSKRSGKTWVGGGEIWCDPTSKSVQDYIMGLSMEMAEKGVDEIQFDYIRFPTGGDIRDASYSFQGGAMSREEVIADFLKRAHEKISSANARLSIDIFGVVAWGKKVDIDATGQRIELLSQHCDYISPMLYPSHFNNRFDGYANPADHPYYFINEGNKKLMALLANKEVVVRPWLQAFKWKVSSFGPQYIIKQIQASDDSGARGYLFWNASNEYRNVLSAMESLTQSGKVK